MGHTGALTFRAPGPLLAHPQDVLGFNKGRLVGTGRCGVVDQGVAREHSDRGPLSRQALRAAFFRESLEFILGDDLRAFSRLGRPDRTA